MKITDGVTGNREPAASLPPCEETVFISNIKVFTLQHRPMPTNCQYLGIHDPEDGFKYGRFGENCKNLNFKGISIL